MEAACLSKCNVKMQKTFIWSHILRVVQLHTQSHTWPMCWYVWLTNNKSKCQFYNRVLQEGCNVHDRLWNSTVMCKNLTAWTLPYPLPFGVKNSQFPSTMGSFVSIQPYRPGWQEPEPSHVTGMALAHCILGKYLGVVFYCFPRL